MMKLRHLFALIALVFASSKLFAGPLVYFTLFVPGAGTLGEVDVELYNQDKTVTVNNFLKLIQGGVYNSGFFHRCVPGFVVQGGEFFAANYDSASAIDPTVFYPSGNLGVAGNFGNITNEFGVGKFYSNTNWTIAMAKTSDPNSANSQFFFNLADNASSLDNSNNSGGFTVFGHTVRGTNVLSFFNTLSYGAGIVDLTKTYGTAGAATVMETLPTLLAGTNAPPYYYLFYYNIGILNLRIQNTTNGARQLTWPVINGVTNNLEYATNLPPSWQVLYSTVPTNSTGTLETVTDTSTNKNGRFYRVHVLF